MTRMARGSSIRSSRENRLARSFRELRVMRSEDAAPGSLPFLKESSRRGWRNSGELEIRGPWIASQYYESSDQAHRWTPDGWFRTGDVATIDEEGSSKSWIARRHRKIRRRVDQLG